MESTQNRKNLLQNIVDVTNLKLKNIQKKCEAKETNKICYDDDQCILFTGGKNVKVVLLFCCLVFC